jgi:hypothetical protein
MKNIAKLLPAMLIAATLALPAQAAVLHGSQSGMTAMTSRTLEGRNVIGMNGKRLGYILAVNNGTRMVELQTPGGIAVSMPESRLRLFGGEVVAINMTRGDVVAMARRQTGRTVAVNLDLRDRGLRG